MLTNSRLEYKYTAIILGNILQYCARLQILNICQLFGITCQLSSVICSFFCIPMLNPIWHGMTIIFFGGGATLARTDWQFGLRLILGLNVMKQFMTFPIPISTNFWKKYRIFFWEGHPLGPLKKIQLSQIYVKCCWPLALIS